jgi:DNA-binding response OmpR family regulator
MNLFALSGLLTGLTSFGMGIFVLLKGMDNRLNRYWFFFTSSVAAWGFGGLWIALERREAMALLAWRSAFALGVVWIPILFYHFVYIFCDLREKLILRAIKFTPSGGKITVTCRLEGEQVCISVRDTGIGIPLEVQSKIFDRFFQAHGATTRPYEGTGIGLAIAKELVELHGGTISVKGAPDGGTIFSFTLPWKREMESSELGPEWIPSEGFGQLSREANYNTADLAPHSVGPKTSISSTGSRPKILVIEDNADMRYFLSEKLSEYYDVLAAADGEEGVQIAKESHPDLILSDVMMPKKDGYEVCRELKNDPDTASLPILLLTAKADLPSKLEGFQSRADDYLIKPFNADELLARVRTQIERRNSVKSLEEYLKEAHCQVKEANLLMMEMAHEIKNPISYAKRECQSTEPIGEGITAERGMGANLRRNAKFHPNY